jgi:hypothetical protein
MSEIVVVKVQLPLASSEKTPMALVYNEDKTLLVTIAVTQELIAKFRGKLKIYANASYDRESEKLNLLEVLADQPW